MMPPALQWSRHHHPQISWGPSRKLLPPHLLHALSLIFVHPASHLCLKPIFSFPYMLSLLYSLLSLIGFHSKLLCLPYLCQNDRVASLLFVILCYLLSKSECLFAEHKAAADLTHTALGPLGGSHRKESSCSAGGLGLIPQAGWSPGEGNGHPLQESCLENPMDGGSWQATVHGLAQSWTWLIY